MSSFDFGPWIRTGATSTSLIVTFKPEWVGEAMCPQAHVAVGEREPGLVLLEAEENRVVDDPAVGRRDEHVLRLTDRAPVQVARGHHVRERERVGPRDLDLALHADVPHRDVVQQMRVLGHQVAVVPRVVRVVIHAVSRNAVLARRVEVRRLPDPRVEQDPAVLIDGQRTASFRRSPGLAGNRTPPLLPPSEQGTSRGTSSRSRDHH